MKTLAKILTIAILNILFTPMYAIVCAIGMLELWFGQKEESTIIQDLTGFFAWEVRWIMNDDIS